MTGLITIGASLPKIFARIALAAAIVSLLTAMVAGYFVYSGLKDRGRSSDAASSSRIESIEAELRVVRTELEAMRQDTRSAPGAERERIDKIEKELAAIQANLRDSPEKALSLPMLRQDLSHLSENQRGFRAELGTIYNIMMWIAATIVSAAIALIGIAAARFIKPVKIDLNEL